MVKTKKGEVEKLVNINKPVAIVPSLAIHMNREANKGFEFNPQNHLQVVLTADSEAKNVLKTLVAKEIGEKPENIGQTDLFVYDLQGGTFGGIDDEFISTGRLDNLQMCHSILTAFLAAKPGKATTVAAFYDNEEIGSRTPMGADSSFTRTILERIVALTSDGRDDRFVAFSKSFLISADGAHTQHPNFPEKHDPAYAPKMNKGPVIKFSSSFRYATTAETSSVFEQLCENAGVPCQKIANRSDVPSGSTIGPMSSASRHKSGRCRQRDVGYALDQRNRRNGRSLLHDKGDRVFLRQIGQNFLIFYFFLLISLPMFFCCFKPLFF